jgi:uncharacterized protein
MYAVFGIFLVALYKAPSKMLYVLAILLVIQIPFLYKIVQSFQNPELTATPMLGSHLWAESELVCGTGSLFDVMSFNLVKGKIITWGWTISIGRYVQLMALFIAGLLIGRLRVFEKQDLYKRNFVIAFIISVVVAVSAYGFKQFVVNTNITDYQRNLLSALLGSYIQLAVTFSIITGIVRLFPYIQNSLIASFFSSYGRMSLTNYVTQALLGVVLFYGFGIALYRYMGATWSLILGFLVFILQGLISMWWSKQFKYGPLEGLWRKLTDIQLTNHQDDEPTILEPFKVRQSVNP